MKISFTETNSILLESKEISEEAIQSTVSLRKENGDFIGNGVLVSWSIALTATEVIEKYENLTREIPKYKGIYLLAGTKKPYERCEIEKLEILKLSASSSNPLTNSLGLIKVSAISIIFIPFIIVYLKT